MVESTALEMRHTGNRIVGSNPTLSAIDPNQQFSKPDARSFYERFSKKAAMPAFASSVSQLSAS